MEDTTKQAVTDLVKQFSADLDAGNKSTIESVATSLMAYPMAELLPILKAHLGIERIIKNDLDEDANFRPLLDRANELPTITT